MMLRKTALRAWVFGLALVANPAYVTACSGHEGSDEFTYGEAELVGLLDDVNATASWEFEGYALSLELEQQTGEATARAEGLVRSAHACGSRTFVKSAAACLDITEMPLEGTATVTTRLDDGTIAPVATVPVSGKLLVTGLDLKQAELSLYFDGGSMFLLWTPEGDFELWSFGADRLGPDAAPVSYNAY